MFVVATKVDLPGRAVSEREGRDWASAQGFPYFEVCAGTHFGRFRRFLCTMDRCFMVFPVQCIRDAGWQA
jgi:hypothetical protein